MGLSDFKQKRAFLDWPDDIIELADFLQIEKFAVEGVSGGGPYALASAYRIAHRLTNAGILSGTGPKWNAGEPWRKPRSLEDTKDFWLECSKWLKEPDRKVVLNTKTLKLLSEELFEAFRQGADGPAYEAKMYGKDWGFRLEDISQDVDVHLWHGELDLNVPISTARAVASAIPNCKAKFYPQEGHYSTLLNHLEEIFKTLKSDTFRI